MIGAPGWTEMLVLGFIALLLFGKRLPEVARSLGQGFVEFKRGMQNINTDMQSAVYSEPKSTPAAKPAPRVSEDLRPTAEKFEVEDDVPADDSSEDKTQA